ncbi:MAG: TadE/TadG family type IV pilus assembly protein, partial [Sulfobacillus sp.]
MNTRTHLKRGQALVETALVLPLVLLLIFGIISYGLYINAVDTVQQA